MGLTEGLITNALYDVAKKILKKDPIRSALDETIEEITREKQDGWYELREIDRNQKEIINNINIIEEATFLKILNNNGVLPETASRLYRNFSEKFNEIINEAAKKEPEVFFPYVIREFERNKTNNEELVKLLTRFAHKNEVYLDRIIKHFMELDIIPNIPDIQSVLRKGETTEGEFFRKEPAWVDYEQGFIVERKEVDEIIKKLDNNKVQLILGAPASGKSIILKNVGFKLANDGKKVYVVELKKHPQDEIKLFFENIPKIDDDNPIFIVDDAHLYLSECERLIRNFKRIGKGKFIIGSRETSEITKEHPKEGVEYELLSELSKTCIKVQAEDVTKRMIETFLGMRYHFDKGKIETVSSNLDNYKNDLWHLSWALKAYNKDKESVDIDEIYRKIATSIEMIRVGKDKETINGEDVFLPLSIFYRYEIPIERKFLEKQLGIKKEIIEQLIKISEIVKTEDRGKPIMLSLNHSSLAELYCGAYQNYPSLGEEIRDKILNGKDEGYLEYCSFHRYIMTISDSRNSINVVISLRKEVWNDKKDGFNLLKKLIEEKNIQKLIVIGLEKEDDIEKVGACISNITMANREVAMNLVERINIHALSSKIDKEKDIGKVGKFVLDIEWVSKEVATKLVDSIDIHALSLKINTEEDIVKIGGCVDDIAWASKPTRLFEVSWIYGGVDDIAWISEKVVLKLVESIDITILSSKIDKENDIEMVGLCVSCIAKASEEMAIKLLDSIDIHVLSSKIDKEEDIGKVELCVSGIARASKEVALKLADSVSVRINKEDDLINVGSCVSGIARASKEVALKLADSVSARIDKEKDFVTVEICVSKIAGESRKVGNEIVNRLNPKLRDGLRKRIPRLWF